MSGGAEEPNEEASGEETCQQSPSYQAAEEDLVIPQTETPDSEECHDNDDSPITVDLTVLTRHRSKEEALLSDSPHTGTDVNAQQTLENSGGGGGESEECTDRVETVETECILTEENIDGTISTAAAAASSPGEQEDVPSEQETEVSDETDVCSQEL